MTKTQTEKTDCFEISENLLEELEKSYPDELPTYEPSAFELGKMVGAREVINKIILLTKSNEIDKLLSEANNV